MKARNRSVKSHGEKGFITLYILAVSGSVFLSLGGAMAANRGLQRLNRQHAYQLSQRARLVVLDVSRK